MALSQVFLTHELISWIFSKTLISDLSSACQTFPSKCLPAISPGKSYKEPQTQHVPTERSIFPTLPALPSIQSLEPETWVSSRTAPCPCSSHPIKCQVLPLSSFFKKIIYLFIYLWLCWVFVSVRGLSLVVASGGHSSSWCTGLSLSRPLLLRSTGSRRAGSAVVAHGPSCSAACGIFPDKGSNPCPLHWQADSQPLRHQGSPTPSFLKPPQISSLSLPPWLLP